MRHLDEFCALRVIGVVSRVCRATSSFAYSRQYRVPTETLHMLGLHVAAAPMGV